MMSYTDSGDLEIDPFSFRLSNERLGLLREKSLEYLDRIAPLILESASISPPTWSSGRMHRNYLKCLLAYSLVIIEPEDKPARAKNLVMTRQMAAGMAARKTGLNYDGFVTAAGIAADDGRLCIDTSKLDADNTDMATAYGVIMGYSTEISLMDTLNSLPNTDDTLVTT